MKSYIKRVALGLTVLGIGASSTVAFAADFTDCNGGFVVRIADTISCNQQSLSYANTATSTRVTVNRVRLNRAGKSAIVNQGFNQEVAAIPGCRVRKATDGTTSSSPCSGLVFHSFFLE